MVVNLKNVFATINEPWVPKVAGELNGQHVKVAKFQGEYIWHQHPNEDELFLVVEGEIQIHLRDQVVDLKTGEFYIVPRGVEHKPVAERMASVLLFEPKSTRNTGTTDHPYTLESEELEKT